MAYADFEDVKKILKARFLQYPDDISNEIEFAEAKVNTMLAGHYTLRFDDLAAYTSVPIEIKWITSLLVGWRLEDQATVLEGQTSSTAGKRWKREAEDWLKCLAEGECRLTLEDGTLIDLPSSSLPRSYPDGVRSKAPSEDNDPFFTRDQAHVW